VGEPAENENRETRLWELRYDREFSSIPGPKRTRHIDVYTSTSGPIELKPCCLGLGLVVFAFTDRHRDISRTMDIDSLESLQLAEKHIKQIIQHYKLEEVLISLRQGLDIVPAFILGATALFAIRYCKPGQIDPNYRTLEWQIVHRLTDLVAQFQLADPLGVDRNIQEKYYDSNPVFTLLRIFGNQAPYSIDFFGQHARPLLLFQEIPKQIAGSEHIPKFDLEDSFQKISGVSSTDFINVGYVSFAAAHSNAGFTRGYFEKARSQEFNLPKGNLILPALSKLAADARELKQIYLKHRLKDRRFAMYDFNPLFLFPIVRPWQQKTFFSMDLDRLVAPIPNLILYRISTGVFYDLFNHFKTPTISAMFLRLM
jgi:hypothetical protein